MQSRSFTSRLAISLARLPYVILRTLHTLLHHLANEMWMNVSGTLNVFRLLRDPTLCLPQYTVSTFNHLPIPLSKAFPKKNGKEADIQAVVLDKDNCFALPHTDEVHKPYKVVNNPALVGSFVPMTMPPSQICRCYSFHQFYRVHSRCIASTKDGLDQHFLTF